jgi:two-component system cell cycle response regulator DivK
MLTNPPAKAGPTQKGSIMPAPVVLYVEDDFQNRVLVRRVLEASGFTVIEAENGFRGMELAKDLLPDLILMDINLPEMDGYEVTSRLKTVTSLANVPIVAMTANVMKGDREKTLAAGCDGYIQKPIDVDSLPQQIRQFINARR